MPFTSEKQRRFMFAEHPRIAKRWAHEAPDKDQGLPTYAHGGTTTSPEVKSKWERVKRLVRRRDMEKKADIGSRLFRIRALYSYLTGKPLPKDGSAVVPMSAMQNRAK
jgi:hypothetical protein